MKSLILAATILLLASTHVLAQGQAVGNSIARAIKEMDSKLLIKESCCIIKDDALKSAPTPSPTPAATQISAPKNSITIEFQAVDKYHGGVVGEIFASDPAPRLIAAYTRTTGIGDLTVSSWNSTGRKFNLEGDLGLAWSKWGWNAGFTRFFVRGGDIDQTSFGKSGSVNLKGRTLTLGADLKIYTKARASSPPGGVVGKFSIGYAKPFPGFERLQVRHRFEIGADNNPFGLGRGVSGLAFYNIETAYKLNDAAEMYASWLASDAVWGRGNTTRRFRNSFAIGYRWGRKW